MAGGFDLGAIFRSPVLLVTLVVAVIGWFVAFIGQCVGEASYKKREGAPPLFGTLWFAIWVQIFVICLFVFSAAGGALGATRFQLAIFTAIAVVFAAQGTQNLYAKGLGSALAAGAGWLLLLVVDLVWLLFLTSDEDSFMFSTLGGHNMGGSWGASPGGARGGYSGGRSGRSEAGVYSAESSGLRHNGAERGMSAHELPTSNGGYMNNGYSSSIGGYQTPAPMNFESPSKSNVLGSQPDMHSTMGQSTDTVGAVTYKHRARANYNYTASPDDPNEVSFSKGDILDVVDTTGKWYQVRTPTGQIGIAPSNYLALL